MQRKLMSNLKKLISFLICTTMIVATFPLHSLSNVAVANGDIRKVSDYNSLRKTLIEINSNNGGSYEIILTNDIIINPGDKVRPMNKSEGFIFSVTNPDDDECERKRITIKSDGGGTYKIKNLKKEMGLLSVDGSAGVTLDLENVILDGGAEVDNNGFKSGDLERRADFIKFHGTYNNKDQSYALEVNFKNGATIQNVNQNFDSDSKVVNVDASKFNFCGGSIKCCRACQGGAIYLSGGLLSLTCGEISKCKAKNGGAIFSYGGQIEGLSKENGGFKINSCDASDFGGAIYATLEDACFNGLELRNCKAGVAGGAIYGTKSGLTKIDDVTIEGCSVNNVDESFDDEKLLGCGGGAIANDDQRQLMIKGCNISNCSTNMNGGAILNCPGAKLAIYGGKIKNCFISKNKCRISPENLDKNAKKYLGNAICNNSSGGMVIVKPGDNLEIEVSSRAQGNDMLDSICGYRGMFDRTYYETGKMSEDPNDADAELYDESWGILLTGGALTIKLVTVRLDDEKDENNKILKPGEELPIEKYLLDPEMEIGDNFYGPTNRGATLTYQVENADAQLDSSQFAISIDGGKKFWYPAKEKDESVNGAISGISIVNGSKRGLNNTKFYSFHICGSNEIDGKNIIVVQVGESKNKASKETADSQVNMEGGNGINDTGKNGVARSQPFQLWIDLAPPEAPVSNEIDGSKLESKAYLSEENGDFYKFKNMDETKYFTHEPIKFTGTGEQGCILEIYKSDDLDGGVIKSSAEPIASTDIGELKFQGNPNKHSIWEITLDKVADNLPDSEKVGLIFVQRDRAGNMSLKTGVYVGVDMHGPEGKMKFDVLDDWFGNFLTNLTFGLFSPEKFDVEVKARDLGSGVKSVKWLKSDEIFESADKLQEKFPPNSDSWIDAQKISEQDVNENIDNVERTLKESTWKFQINKAQNERFFVYAQLMDISGNIEYLRSDGAVFYTPMASQDLTYFKKSATDPSSGIALNGNEEIFDKTLDGTPLLADSIKTEITETLFKFSLKSAYLDSLQAAQHDVSFKYYPFNLKAKNISPKHCAFPSVNFKLNIKKSDLSDANFKIKGYQNQYTYGDNSFKVYVEGLPEGLKAKFEIENVEGNGVAAVDNDGNVTLKGAGKFKIKASTDENENYNAFSAQTEVITVLPCPIKIGGLKCADREYDSTNILKIFQDNGLTLTNGANAAKFNLNLTVSGTEWAAKFEDASVGQNKEAKFEEAYFDQHFSLTGPDAANCFLEMPTFKANIIPKKLKFNPQSVKIKSKDYDATDKAEFEEIPKFLDDFANNELQIDNLPIRFENAMPGQNKQVFIDKDRFEWSLKNNSYSKDNYDLSELLDQPIGTANIFVTKVAVDDFPEYINKNTLEVSGTGIPGYEIKITDSNGNAMPVSQSPIIVGEDGKWKANLINLHKRDNSINVIQKDPGSDIQSSPVSKSVFVDVDLPTGQILINDSAVNTKILVESSMGDQKIFEMFYLYSIGVKIFAQDAFSGVDYIKYFVSDQFYSTSHQLANASNIAWVDGINVPNYRVSQASAKFDINKENESKKFFIYTKIKDKAGNVIYLRTYGVVLYDEMDVDGNLSYTRCSDQPSTVKIDLHGSVIENVKLKSKDGLVYHILTKDTQWTVENCEDGQFLKLTLGDLDELLEAGEYEIEVLYKPSCLSGEPEENIDAANLPCKKIDLSVRDLDLSDQYLFGDLASQTERIYGDEVNLSSDKNITYRVESLGGNAEILNRAETGNPYAKMTKVGKVNVVASYRNIYTRTLTITINKKCVTINNIHVRNKEYDKTADAEYYSKLDGGEIAPFNRACAYLEAKHDSMSERNRAIQGSKHSYINKQFEVEGLLDEDLDRVYVKGDRVLAQFENCFAGDNKKVNFNGFELCDVNEELEVAENYMFIQPSREASITKKPIKIVDIQIVDKIFDDSVGADFSKDPVVTGVVKGDRVWIKGKPVFADKGPGASIPVYRGSVVLEGEDASNYELIWPDIVANIYPAPASADNGGGGGGGDGGSIIKPTAGENDFDSDFVNKYEDPSHAKGLAEDSMAENVITCLAVFLTVSLLSTLAIILIRNKNKQR